MTADNRARARLERLLYLLTTPTVPEHRALLACPEELATGVRGIIRALDEEREAPRLAPAARASAKVPRIDLGAGPIWLDELATHIADRLTWTSVIVDEGVGVTEAWGARHVHHDYVLEAKGLPERVVVLGYAHAFPVASETSHLLEETDGCELWLHARIDRLTVQRMPGEGHDVLWRFRADVSLATEAS